MKRMVLTAAVLAAALFLTACRSLPRTNSPAEPTQAAHEAQETAAPEETVPETHESAPQRMADLPPGETVRVFDESGVLGQKALEAHNAYLCDLAARRLIECGVCITESLDGASPEHYAAERYRAQFGAGTSGFLILINNDTGHDVIHTEGACSLCLTQSVRQTAVMQASPLLVEGKYDEALTVLEPVGEHVPEHVYDRAGLLSGEETQALLDMASWQQSACDVLLLVTLPEAEAQASGQTQGTDADGEEETEAPEHDGTDAPEEEASDAPEAPAEPEAPADAQEALGAYAQETAERLGSQTLLVFDVQHEHCVIVGEAPEDLQSAVWRIWREEGAYNACTAYYEAMQGEGGDT